MEEDCSQSNLDKGKWNFSPWLCRAGVFVKEDLGDMGCIWWLPLGREIPGSSFLFKCFVLCFCVQVRLSVQGELRGGIAISFSKGKQVLEFGWLLLVGRVSPTYD